MAVPFDDSVRFSELCAQELGVIREKAADQGIGTFSEKRMHRILKRFVLDVPSCHEVKIGGKYIADVASGNDIWEIQTGSLYPLSNKIAYYLANTEAHVTVVHPVPAKKYLVWVDPCSGDVTRRHASTKKPGVQSVLPEMVYLSDMLHSGRISVRLIFIEEEEYRFLDGVGQSRKKHSSRYERLPVALLEDITVDLPSGAGIWLPADLPSPFTASEFGKVSKLTGRDIYKGLIVLEQTGWILRAGKRGRAQEWEKTDKFRL